MQHFYVLPKNISDKTFLLFLSLFSLALKIKTQASWAYPKIDLETKV